MMTPTQYAAENGMLCPVCQHNDIQGWSPEMGCGTAHQTMQCLSCRATWVDEYKIAGYHSLEHADD